MICLKEEILNRQDSPRKIIKCSLQKNDSQECKTQYFEIDENITFLDPLVHTYYMGHEKKALRKTFQIDTLIGLLKKYADHHWSCNQARFDKENGKSDKTFTLTIKLM